MKCTNANDKYTTTTSKGNGKLSYSVGLITADEINMAGVDIQVNQNSRNYLNIGDYYWVGSSFEFRAGVNAFEFGVNEDGDLSNSSGLLVDGVDGGVGVRGVVSLSSDAKLLGSGTYDDVYVVS